MNKNLLIALVIVGALVVAGFFVLNDKDSDDSTDNSSNNSISQVTPSGEDNPLGLALGALEGSYRITVSSTDEDGVKNSGTIEIDEAGDSKSTFSDGGRESSIITVDGFTYVENPDDGSWIKYPQGIASQSGFDQNLALSQEDIEDLNTLDITDMGKGDCTAGTCRIYGIKDSETNSEGIVKVDDKTNRLSDIETTDEDGTTASIAYEFDNGIKITAPANAVEFETPDFDLN